MDDILLILMMIGGVTLFATAFLPGNHIAWRILCAVAGPALFFWMVWVFLFGGTYIVNLFIVLLPFLLAGQSIRAMVQARRMPAQSPWAPPDAYGQQPYDQPMQGQQPYEQQPYGQQPSYPPQQPYPGEMAPQQPYQQGPPPGQQWPQQPQAQPYPQSPPPGQWQPPQQY